MQKLADKPAKGTTNALHPAYLRQCRGYALLAIMGQFDDDYLAKIDDHGLIARYKDDYRARGMRPERAALLFSRLNAGRELYAIDGGGVTTEPSARPTLTLAGAA